MFRWSFNPHTRNPLARLLAVLVGAVALVAVLAFGLFAAVALIVGGSIVLLVNAMRQPRPATASPASPPPPPPGVIEGEFKVVHDSRAERQPAR
jgi:hypothetical protein